MDTSVEFDGHMTQKAVGFSQMLIRLGFFKVVFSKGCQFDSPPLYFKKN